jgi:hypothetical protein
MVLRKRYDEGFKDGAQAVVDFLGYCLAGSHSGSIDKSLIERWLDKADKRFLMRKPVER